MKRIGVDYGIDELRFRYIVSESVLGNCRSSPVQAFFDGVVCLMMKNFELSLGKK